MTGDPAERRLVWDVPVRVVHWMLVLAVAGSWTTHLLGPSYFTWHVVCGCVVLVLVTFRIVWGFIGTRYARFSSFVHGPRVVWAYLRGAPRGAPRGAEAAPTTAVGHNPLGGLSVVLLLLLLLAQGLTGLFSNDAIANVGPLYGWVSSGLSDALTSIHHRIFDVLQWLILLHIGAVLFYTFIRRAGFIGPMFSGYKPAGQVPAGQEISGSRLFRALILLAVVVGLLMAILLLAPAAQL